MHIGLIGGIGPAATIFYYRTLTENAARAGRPLELTIAHAQNVDLVRHMSAKAADAQAHIFAALTRRLQAAGAEQVAVTSMGGHFCAREFAQLSTLPVIDALPSIRAELNRLGVRRVGLLGTQVVMGSRMYGALGEFDVAVPASERCADTAREYLAMAGAARVTEQQREFFFDVGRGLMADGADAILLGGTDFFLAFEGYDCGFPTVDSARVHAEAIARLALA